MPADTENTIRYGIIGSGRMARRYADIVAGHVERATLAGVTGGSRAAALAADYDVPCFDDPAALIRDRSIDAVVIATPPAVHAEHAFQAIDAGKHLLVEKPLATTIEDCDRIVRNARDQRVKGTTAFAQRYHTVNIKARELVHRGDLGRVLHVDSALMTTQAFDKRAAWELEPENLGYLFGFGVHNIDFIRWLTGREIASVFSTCGNVREKRDVETTAEALLTLDNGVVARLFCSYEMPVLPSSRPSCFLNTVTGTQGLLRVDSGDRLSVAGDGSDWTTVETEPISRAETIDQRQGAAREWFRRLVEDLTDSIVDDREPAITLYDARQAVAVVLACYESNRSRRETRVASFALSGDA